MTSPRRAPITRPCCASSVSITYKAIDWRRTQHPGAVLDIRTGGGKMDPAMQSVLALYVLTLVGREKRINRQLEHLRKLLDK